MSFAEPNLYLEPRGFSLPTIVFVMGFSHLHPYLLMQKDVWLIGGAAYVNVVFIVVWCRISQSRVEGRLEIWRKNQQGPETFVRISPRNVVFFLDAQLTAPFQDIFPRPSLGTPPQEITIRRDELCGNAIRTGRKPSDVWRLSLERLRYRAEQAIRNQGYVPA